MPRHSMTPRQASPNPSNFGDTWKYLCSSAASSWSLEGSMCQLMDTPSWSSLWQGICFRAQSCRNHACRTSRAATTHSARILSRPTQSIFVPEIETKNGLCQKRHKLSKTKRHVAAPKKNSQWTSIKFHSSTSEARDSLHASSCQNRRSYTVFSVSCWHWGGTLMEPPGSQYFPKLELDSTSSPLPPRPMLIQT